MNGRLNKAPPRGLLFHGARVFDGTSTKDVLVRGGKIAAFGEGVTTEEHGTQEDETLGAWVARHITETFSKAWTIPTCKHTPRQRSQSW